MTVKELINTFEYSNTIQLISYNAESWRDDLKDDVDKRNIPKTFEPYLNRKIKEINLETYISGQCCGYDIETPYLEIVIE